MKRRDFIRLGSFGVPVALVGAIVPNARAVPCPPGVLTIDGTPAGSSDCGSRTVAAFRLESSSGGARLPFTIGHAFRQGDVPAGLYLDGSCAEFQAEVRNRWSDGSVKFAVLSGLVDLSASQSSMIELMLTDREPSTHQVSEPDPTYLGENVAVTISGPGSGTYTPQEAAANGLGIWSRSAPSKLREFIGPIMSEFHYYTPTSDDHLGVWWYVRVYVDGRMEVETAIEQGWIKVASVTNKTYSVTVTIGGIARTNLTSLSHRHHTRWSRRDWIGTDPQITPTHDGAYLRATKLVPNYADVPISSNLLGAYAQTPVPMSQGNYPSDGSGTGAHSFLGLLSEWEAAYVISGDVRALRSVLANEQAQNCMWYGGAGGSLWGFGFVCRDENTGLPISTISYVNESFSGGSAAGGVQLGTTSGKVWSTDSAHSGNGGYLAYLLTGRWFSLETVQFNHGVNHLSVGGGNINRMVNVGTGDRTHAWLFRTMACAICITPDDHPLRSGLISYAQTNINAWRTGQVGFNNLGLRRTPLDGWSDGPGSTWNCRSFMQDFISQSFPFVRDVCGHTLPSVTQTQLLETAQFHAIWPVGKLGTRPGGFCFKSAALYNVLCGPTRPTSQGQQGTFSADFGALFDLNSSNGYVSTAECVDESVLVSGNIPEATSYWGNFHPAIAQAVDLGISGASAAYGRMTRASNYSSLYSDFSRAPQWAIVPRT